MPGCFLPATPDIPLQVTIAMGTAQSVVSIPNDPALASAQLFCQSVVVAPGVNHLGVISSNGVHVTVGY